MVDNKNTEEALRRVLAEHGREPDDLSDLTTAVRGQVSGQGHRGWLPLGAACAVLVIIAGVIVVSRFGPSPVATSPTPPNPPTTSVPTPTPEVVATLTAHPATKPYLLGPGSYQTVDFMAPDPPAACTSKMLSMTLTGVRTTSGDSSGAKTSTEFTVLARATSTHDCTIDMHGLAAEARTAAGKVVSQPFAAPAVGLPSVLVEPGDLVILNGTWAFSCNVPDGPLTLTVENPSFGDTAPGWVLGEIPAPSPIDNCEHWAGGGPSLLAVAVSRPGSILTLDARLDMPAHVAPGVTFRAAVELTNHTRTTVSFRTCPDFVFQRRMTADSTSPSATTWRVDCPSGLSLAPGQSLDLVAPLTAPESGSVIVRWGWAGSDFGDFSADAAEGTYLVAAAR